MVLLLFFALLAFVAVFVVGPSRLLRWVRQDTRQASATTVPPLAPAAPAAPEAAESDPEQELTERIVTAERLAGILSLEDYQRAMAVIAAKDAVSHPLAVPPERL